MRGGRTKVSYRDAGSSPLRHCLGSLAPGFVVILHSDWVERVRFGIMAFDRRSQKSVRKTEASGQNSTTLALSGAGQRPVIGS
jgi:hypothetical protein